MTESSPSTISEILVAPRKGWQGLLLALGMLLLGPLAVLFYELFKPPVAPELLVAPAIFLGLMVGVVTLFGLIAVQPNTARVLLLFGSYVGTVKQPGFYWVNPFYSKKKLSLRIRNFETGSTETPEQKNAQGEVISQQRTSTGRPSKVNDRDGNPIEISAVVVWRVVDTAEAMFEVDDFKNFVRVQSEAALRNLATRHPYDSSDHEESLRANSDAISNQLRTDIQERLHRAGVDVLEARISHLAYASEIAAAMLQRQQASAVVAARTKIVEGAVGMVEQALDSLKENNIVDLDDERRATMVSNLLVVLCSDRHTQPVINTGSLY